MTKTIQDMSHALDIALSAIVQGMKKEDLNAAQCSLKELISHKNAYTQGDADVEAQQRWNMITYKKGRKSSL